MSKKVTNVIKEEHFNEETGKYEIITRTETFTIPEEEHYYKFYQQGLMYISDMPAELHKVFYALLDNMTYVNQKVEGLGDYGMHIFLNADVKRAIAKSLGYSNVVRDHNHIIVSHVPKIYISMFNFCVFLLTGS